MKWRMLYSARAKEDLQSIYEYIAYDLHEPEIALGQVRAIMDEIRDLDEMPMRYRQYEVEPWISKGIRIFSVGKYVILYQPEESNHEVNIVRIMYGGRDISKQLSEK